MVVGGGVGVKGVGDVDEAGFVVVIAVAVAVVIGGVRVIAGDGVGAEVGIAVGGGACRVNNTDGVVAVAVVIGVVDVEGMDSVDEASGVVKVAVVANDVAACGQQHQGKPVQNQKLCARARLSLCGPPQCHA